VFSALMLLVAIADTVLFAWILRSAWRHGTPVLWLLAFLIAALPYDTLLVAAGHSIGAGDLLQKLSAPRFMLFDLSIPLTLIVAGALARRAGLAFAQPRWVMMLFCGVASAFILLDWQGIIVAPQLFPACWADTLRYTMSVDPTQLCPGRADVPVKAALPPAALLALPMLLVVGALIWWRRAWPWMFAGSVASFALLGLPGSTFGPIPGFIGDALNMLALAVTATHFVRARPRFQDRNIR
jgi:hypothetical protein